MQRVEDGEPSAAATLEAALFVALVLLLLWAFIV